MNTNGWDVARRRIEAEREAQTGVLDLGQLGLLDLPPELFELNILVGLNLGERYRDEEGEVHHPEEIAGLPNRITALPPAFARLNRLRWLSITDNPITDLTPLKELTALQSLNLSNTGVVDLTTIKGLIALQSLEFSHTEVSDLAAIEGLTALQSLYCSATKVSNLAAIEGLTNLHLLACGETLITDLTPLKQLSILNLLDCSGTKVVSLTPLKALRALESFNCSRTEVASLAPLRGLTALESLRCSRTQVTDISSLEGLAALQSLDCSRTTIASLAPLKGLTALQSLACSHTEVDDLDSLTGLTALKSLNCGGSRVADLAPLREMTALESLRCEGTKVSSLAPLKSLTALHILDCSNTKIDDLTPLTSLQALHTLRFRDTDVSSLAPLKSLGALQILDCSRTKVSDLTPLSGLTTLRSLRCGGTKVSSLAPLKSLTALRALNCMSTQVFDLTPLDDLRDLRALDCSDTRVVDLTPLRGLNALQSLDCWKTDVSSLVPLSALQALGSLNCSATKVTDLTPLTGLTALWSLDCSGTGVTNLAPLPKLVLAPPFGDETSLNASWCVLDDLPPAIVRNPDLENLDLFETRIPGLPNEVLSQDENGDNCLSRVRAHLDDLEAGAIPLHTTKMIVLGNGRVGKTQLCRRLRGLDFDPNVPSTHGITIASTDFDSDETLSLWDFGGQDIYHGVHALFMRTRAIFVIAWQPEMEANPTHTYEGLVFHNHPLIYWLEFVRTMGAAGSPIIIVQCQCEHRRDEVSSLPVEQSALTHLNIIPVAYSANTDRGRERLNEAIVEAIAELRARDGLASIGRGRARVVEQLEEWRAEDELRAPPQRMHRTLTREAFTAVCKDAGGVSSPAALLNYLHHSGLIFHNAEQFGDRILLDQTWALDAVYTVFDRHRAWRHLQATHGRFTRSLLEATVWREYTAEDQRLFLETMLSCGICFRHRSGRGMPSDDEEYIAPDLLPDANAINEHLAGRWDEDAPGYRLVYAYEFLHPGLFRGLMSEIGQKARSAGVYWRTGIWLYASQSRTRVRIDLSMENERRGRITLTIQGEDPDLVKWLRERFAVQHQRFGQSRLEPVLDELPVFVHAQETADVPSTTAPRRDDPEFVPLPPVDFKREEHGRPQVFISYAWKDGERAALGLKRVLVGREVDVYLDRNDVKTGDRISAFMDRLVRGDFVFIVLSEEYLRSEACMYELFGIWQRAKSDPEMFLTCVIPIVLPSARIGRAEERFAHAKYWNERHRVYDAMMKENAELVGAEDFARFKKIGDYRLNTSDILFLLNDRLIPRDLEGLERTDFAAVIELVCQRSAERG